MVLRSCCRNPGGQCLGLGFFSFPLKNEDTKVDSSGLLLGRIGSLESTQESVVTILCQVSKKCGSNCKSQLSKAIIGFTVGKSADDPSDVAMSLHDSL